MKILLLGAGYTLQKLAENLSATEHQVHLTSRSERAPDQLGRWHQVEVLNADMVDRFFYNHRFDLIIDSIPPVRGDLFAATKGVSNVFTAIRRYPPARFFYLSTTGVYGEQSGGVVTEQTPAHPLSPQAQARLDSELIYRHLAAQVTCFRIAAISSDQERNPRSSFASGHYPYVDGGSRFTNRIHVDDLVATLAAAIDYPATLPEVLNCSDGSGLTAAELFTALKKRYPKLKEPKNKDASEAHFTMLTNQQVSNQLLTELFPEAIKHRGTDWM